MEKPSTAKLLDSFSNILDFYRTILRKRPFSWAVALVASVIIYLTVLSYIFPNLFTSPISFIFQRQPQLQVIINPTEKYEMGPATLILKRVTLFNKAQSLAKVKITVRASEPVEKLRLSSIPEVQCNWTKFGSAHEGRVLFEILCDSLAHDQRLEINLTTTRPVDEKASIVIEAVGTYARDRLVGVSATGTFK